MVEERTFPSFLVIGPGRSGTSWMYEMLRQHPEVCLARNTKETLFFTEHYHKGISWYARFFDGCSEAKAVGELSNTYIYDEQVPERISDTLPQVHLIACLRDPLDRLYSSYAYKKRSGNESRSLETALHERFDMVWENLYHEQLQRYLEFFPKERLQLFFYDDLQKDPYAFLKELYRAVGVSEEFTPDGVDQRVNTRGELRIPGLGSFLGLASRSLRKIGAYALLDRLKRSKTIKKWLLREKKGEEEALSEATREWLSSYFIPNIEWVESFTGRNLEHWKKNVRGR